MDVDVLGREACAEGGCELCFSPSLCRWGLSAGGITGLGAEYRPAGAFAVEAEDFHDESDLIRGDR